MGTHLLNISHAGGLEDMVGWQAGRMESCGGAEENPQQGQKYKDAVQGYYEAVLDGH